jgi:hypothetical protein
MTGPEKLPVIFRAERTKGGDVTAVFPTLPWSDDGRTFSIYAHIGQHGGGSWPWYRRTRAARPDEYADLLQELRGIYERSHAPGETVFELQVYQRMTPQHRREFETELQRLRRTYRSAAW